MYAAVSSGHATGSKLTAKEWCDFVTKAIGKGKGGGKVDYANATVPVEGSIGNASETTRSILEFAQKYLDSKK